MYKAIHAHTTILLRMTFFSTFWSIGGIYFYDQFIKESTGLLIR